MADLYFTITIIKLLRDLRGDLQEAGLIMKCDMPESVLQWFPTAKPVAVQAYETSFVDDCALPLPTSAEQIVPVLQEVMTKTSLALARYGFEVNTSAGKTEATIQFAGKRCGASEAGNSWHTEK